ncbi:TetR/AcrR family transcriptional regulator [Nocardiopsis nanhaiensis]
MYHPVGMLIRAVHDSPPGERGHEVERDMARGQRTADGTEAGRGSVPERLLRAATRLFAERGFEGTSVQEIVTAAGVTKGAMYHYFGSKDDLLYEVYARVLRMQTDHLVTLSSREAPVAERVHAAAADVLVTSVANLDDTKIFFRSMHQLAPEKQRSVRAERRKYHEIFRGMIEQGQREGVFREDVPADLVVDYFFGSVHHLGTWYRHDGELSGNDVGRHFADLLVAGLRPGV